MNRSFKLSSLANKSVSIISTKESLEDVVPIDWNIGGDTMACKKGGCKKGGSKKKGGRKPC